MPAMMPSTQPELITSDGTSLGRIYNLSWGAMYTTASDTTGNAIITSLDITSTTGENTCASITLGNGLEFNIDSSASLVQSLDGNFSIQTTDGGWGFQSHRDRHALNISEGPEERARGLLRRMVGFLAFRNYIKNGFVTYRAESGKVYQIFPGLKTTQVWMKGQPIERLCVVFQDGKLPPTDSVIMRLLMLENNEDEFRKLAIITGFSNPAAHTPRVAAAGRIVALAAQKAKGEIEIVNGKVQSPHIITFNGGQIITGQWEAA